jgi:hypothetical protein
MYNRIIATLIVCLTLFLAGCGSTSKVLGPTAENIISQRLAAIQKSTGLDSELAFIENPVQVGIISSAAGNSTKIYAHGQLRGRSGETIFYKAAGATIGNPLISNIGGEGYYVQQPWVNGRWSGYYTTWWTADSMPKLFMVQITASFE